LFSTCKANRKSGNNDGDIILSLFRRLLNPAQVVDLAERPPEAALEWCSLLGDVRATILVAGGDGTIGWVLNAVNKLQLKVGT
jgi:diacylglycerol kinase (ATP)